MVQQNLTSVSVCSWQRRGGGGICCFSSPLISPFRASSSLRTLWFSASFLEMQWCSWHGLQRNVQHVQQKAVELYCIHHTHWELPSWFSSRTWQLQLHNWALHFVGLLQFLSLVWGRLFYMRGSESWRHVEWQVIWCSSYRTSEDMVECVGQCTVWNTFCKWYWVILVLHVQLMPSSNLYC